MYKKTTKKEVRKDAEKVAKEWYIDKQIILRASGSLDSVPVFDHFAQLVFTESASRIKRGERSDSQGTDPVQNRYHPPRGQGLGGSGVPRPAVIPSRP